MGPERLELAGGIPEFLGSLFVQKEGLNQDLATFPSLQEAQLHSSLCLLRQKNQWSLIMYGAGEFDDSGGLGLLLGAAQAETDVLHEAAAPSPAAAPLPAPANAPVGATGSLEPATGLDQEQLDSQEGDERAPARPLLPRRRQLTTSSRACRARGGWATPWPGRSNWTGLSPPK